MRRLLKSDIFIIFAIGLVILYSTIYTKYIYNRGLDNYNDFHKNCLIGKVDIVRVVRERIEISVINDDNKYYFTPVNCETDEISFEIIPMIGDSIVKTKNNDTIEIIKQDSIIKILSYSYYKEKEIK